MNKTKSSKNHLKAFGPGLLFASAAIGTSHLILATQGGAHYGLVIGWVILLALVLKYPFFEFAPRYATATGKSLLWAYKKQGKWALAIYLLIIAVGMFTVTGAIAGASAGLLSTFLGIKTISSLNIAGIILLFTGGMLIIGRYTALDNFIKILSIILFVSVLIAFIAVLFKGPVIPKESFIPESMFSKSGMILIIGLMGWMPVGLEASAFSSIWTLTKIESTGYHPTLKESLFDFNFGYVITVLLAFLFLVIGTFTVYGTGEKLVGNPVAFSNKLVTIFSKSIGDWSYTLIALAAFGAIYGTLITVMDGFSRGFLRSFALLRSENDENSTTNNTVLKKNYAGLMAIIALGGFIVIWKFGASLIFLIQIATVISFLGAPIIAYLNIKAIKSLDRKNQPPTWLMNLSYIGLVFMLLFTFYYFWDFMVG